MFFQEWKLQLVIFINAFCVQSTRIGLLKNSLDLAGKSVLKFLPLTCRHLKGMGRTEVVPPQEKVQGEHTKSNKSFSIGLAPEDEVFSRVDISNSNLLLCFAGSLQQLDTAQNFQRAKKHVHRNTGIRSGKKCEVIQSFLHNHSIYCNIQIQQ